MTDKSPIFYEDHDLVAISELHSEALPRYSLSLNEADLVQHVHAMRNEGDYFTVANLAKRMRLDEVATQRLKDKVIKKCDLGDASLAVQPRVRVTHASHPPIQTNLQPSKASFASSIPEELRPLWNQLPSLGAPTVSLAKFEGYVVGSAPMTQEQMEAGCKAMHHFPNKAKYSPLLNFLMNLLHDRYAAASDGERDRIRWVASSLFISANKAVLEYKFGRMMRHIDAVYLPELHNVMEDAVARVLEVPRNGDISALMYTYAWHDLISLNMKVVGDKNSKKGERKRFAYPVSLDEVFEDGTSRMDSLASPSNGPLETLLGLEEELLQQQRLKKLCGAKMLSRSERTFVDHCLGMVDRDENFTFSAIADRMGVTRQMVDLHIHSVGEKMRDGWKKKSRKENTSIKGLADVPDSALEGIMLDPRETELIMHCKAMNKQDITANLLADKMGVTFGRIHELKRSIEEKMELAMPVSFVDEIRGEVTKRSASK